MRQTNRTSPRRPFTRLAVCCALLLVGLLAGLFPGEAAACPVCYGGAEGDVIEGAKLSVFFMGGLVYTVMLGGVAMVVVVRRRAVRRQEPDARPRLRIVREEDPSERTDRPDRSRGED